MKIAIINDTHFGVKNDNQIMLEYQYSFFDNIFFPTLEEQGITNIIHMGDVFDRRKYININTLKTFQEKIVSKSEKLKLKWHIILGNHDIFYKNTSEVSCINEVLRGSKTFKVHKDPVDVKIGGLVIGMVPWTNRENKESILDFINKKSKAKVLCGHMEIAGFFMNTGIKCQNGVPMTSLKRFDRVYSGHFHKRHNIQNVYYTGTPYQMNFGDIGERKGFYILDTDNSEHTEFIENPDRMFHRIYYDDVKNEYDFSEDDFNIYRNKYIKIVVMKKSNPHKFNTLMDLLHEAEASHISIVEVTDYEEETNNPDIDMSKDTLQIIQDEIDNMEHIQDKPRLKDIVGKLYIEAMNSY